MLREEGEEQDKVVKVDMGDDDERTQIIRNASDSVSGQIDVPKVVPGANLALQKEEAKVPVRLEGDSVSLTDTAIVTLSPKTPVVDDVLIAETITDTLGADVADSIVRPVFLPEINIAEIDSRKNRNWQLLAAGSLGPALVQNVYNLIAINTSLLPEIEGPLGEMPSHVSTWEEYCKYLKAIASENASADTLQLIQIAEQNSGKIVHKEHHDKPITFGISVTKSVSDRLSLETGLQYSILKSRFTIGEGGDSAATRQKIHYLGVPLRVSYKWVGYKRLSAYSSVGATLHVPVYSKLVGSADNDWKRIIFGDKPLNPSLQWQVGASVGVQYEFAPNTSLFVEPTVNWFIPSGGETHTIWTEQPVMFTCPFGIRITW
jgi:RNA polymerase sigma-70 factor (ECF subfamily)